MVKTSPYPFLQRANDNPHKTSTLSIPSKKIQT